MHKLVGLVLFSVSFTTVFARNDTILHGWHSASNERGTWSVVWGCVATIFICTWSVLHFDVPRRSASDLERFARRAGYTLLAILAPEILLTIAITETLQSVILKKIMNRDVDRQQGREAWSLTHVRFLLNRGFAKDMESDDVWDPLKFEVNNIPQGPREPPISKKELKSRSSTNWIANTLAIFQISWFGAQLLVRRIQHLHITAREILTLAFIVCSVFTFILCWPQPQNVAYPVILLEDTPRQRPVTTSPKALLNTALEESPASETCLHKEEDRSNKTAHSLEHSSPDVSGALDKSDEDQKRAFDLSSALNRVTKKGYLVAFAGGIFGAVHCLAWNSTFPTPKERLAWRVCSVAITALPTFISLVINLGARIEELDRSSSWDLNILFFMILYTIPRLTLIALALASLRAVPADVFQTTDWSNIIPHIGL